MEVGVITATEWYRGERKIWNGGSILQEGEKMIEKLIERPSAVHGSTETVNLVLLDRELVVVRYLVALKRNDGESQSKVQRSGGKS